MTFDDPANDNSRWWHAARPPGEDAFRRPVGLGSRRRDLRAEAAGAIERAVVLTMGGAGAKAVGSIMADNHNPDWRTAVAWAMETKLCRMHHHVWAHGWQPADVHRLARRRSATVARLAGEAMLSELDGYARVTVHRQFWDQLDEIEATRSWPQESGHLRERTDHADWPDVLIAAVELAALLATLPAIERLVPVPGEARPESDAPAAEVDDRVLARVRGLLAKAESTTFEAEAESFTSAAQALMARHSIDVAMLAAAAGQASTGPGAIRLGIDNPYEQPKAQLLHEVADANNCRAVWAKPLAFATVVGFPPDLAAVESLFTSLLVQATTSMAHEGSRRHWDGSSRTRSFRSSFLMAYAVRIGERLREVTATETAKAGQELAKAGRDLAPVLASRRTETDEAFAAMFPETTQMRSSASLDREGWTAGRAAADLARLSRGAQLRG